MFHIKVSPKNRLLLRAVLLVGVIFLISPALASDDPARCAVNGDALKAIVPAKTPVQPAAVEFFKADGSTMTLSDDAAGTITLDDGSQIAFDGLERIEY